MDRLKDIMGPGGPRPPPPGPGMPPPGISGMSGGAKRPKRRKMSFSEVSWDTYFTTRQIVEVNNDKFCVYTLGEGSCTVLCLHGGGHSSLSWALFARELSSRCSVKVVALDQRGHGDTVTTNDNDLSSDTLVQDVVNVWSVLNGEERPPLVILGHSMGGAVAVRAVAGNMLGNVAGLAVIDVVEGSALDALSAMQGFLSRRPVYFPTVKDAIEWSMKTGQLRNLESARVSVRGQLRLLEDGELDQLKASRTIRVNSVSESISEEGEEAEKEDESGPGYTWKVDLSASEEYWQGWFSGMSGLFLAGSTPKLLLLAGPDRLDTELTVGHMQGKFQTQMFNHSGHSVQEDLPDKVADVVTGFLIRQKLAVPCGDYNPTVATPFC